MRKRFQILGIGVLCLAGCPQPQPQPKQPPDLQPQAPAICPVGAAKPTTASVCEGMFTPDLLPCVRCNSPQAMGCIDSRSEVYCVGGDGTCLGDPACKGVPK